MKLWSVRRLKEFGGITLRGARSEALERKAARGAWRDYAPEGRQ